MGAVVAIVRPWLDSQMFFGLQDLIWIVMQDSIQPSKPALVYFRGFLHSKQA